MKSCNRRSCNSEWKQPKQICVFKWREAGGGLLSRSNVTREGLTEAGWVLPGRLHTLRFHFLETLWSKVPFPTLATLELINKIQNHFTADPMGGRGGESERNMWERWGWDDIWGLINLHLKGEGKHLHFPAELSWIMTFNYCRLPKATAPEMTALQPKSSHKKNLKPGLDGSQKQFVWCILLFFDPLL